MNLIDAFCRQVVERPDALAMVETRRGKSHSITFAELDTASRRAAAMLHVSGLCPGDGVLLLQPMSIDLYVALIAIFRLGLVAIVFDPSAGRAHIERCCSMYPPAAFIGCAKAHLLRLISTSIRRIPRKYVIGTMIPGAVSWRKSDTYVPNALIHPCEANTPALLTFTSGSTGLPKAAMRTHEFLLAQHRVLARSLELQPGEVDLTTMPIFALANLASGVTSIIPDADLRAPGCVDPVPILSQIATWQPTRTGASPAFLECLAVESLKRGETIPHLRTFYTGGAPVFPSFLRTLLQAAPSATIIPVYGSTEAEPIAHLAIDDICDVDYEAMENGKGLLVGKSVSDIHMQIIRHQWGQPIGPYTQEEFIAICQSAGEPGEIVVSGAHVLPGYLHGLSDAETKFRVEGVSWHRTGDAGYLDARGRLWLLGRCAARIEDERGILYPFAVESAAMNHPAIKRTALVLHRGRRVLVVEPIQQQQVDVPALHTALGGAQLDDILIVKYIPVDARHNAKVDYPALMRLIRRYKRCQSNMINHTRYYLRLSTWVSAKQHYLSRRYRLQ